MRLALQLMIASCLCLAAPSVRAAEPVPSVDTGFSVFGAPAGAEIFLDERSIGRAPIQGAYPATPGEHRLRISRIGHAPYNEPFRIFPGRVVDLLVELVPIAAVLRVRTGGERSGVYIDGKFAGNTPLEKELLTGPHEVRLSRNNFKSEAFTVDAVPGQLIERDVPLAELQALTALKEQIAPTESRKKRLLWIIPVALFGAAAVATAIIVPTVFSSRGPCQRVDVEACVPIHSVLAAPLLSAGVVF